MANIIRSAKHGNEWTSNELEAYNISIVFQDAQTFFGEADLPTPSIHQEILTAATADDAIDDASYNLLAQLDLAMMPSGSEESAVNDFVVALFHSLGYVHRFARANNCGFSSAGKSTTLNLTSASSTEIRTTSSFSSKKINGSDVARMRMLNSLPRP